MSKQPYAYRLKWVTQGEVFYIPSDFDRATNKESANIWGLFTEPQPHCPAEVAVYFKGGWVQPKHIPLYLGPLLHAAEHRPEHFRCNQKYLH